MIKDVTVLKIERRNKKYRIYTTQGDYLLSEDAIIKFTVFKDKIFTRSEFKEIIAYEEQMQLLNKTLRYLSYQPRSVDEIKKYLNNHSTDDNVLQSIIDKLTVYGYLDDEKFAESMLDYAISTRKGPVYVKNRLQIKGISDEIINNILAKYSEEQEKVLVEAIAAAYLRKNKGLSPIKLKTKLYQKLVRDGFSFDIVRHIINHTDFPAVSNDKLQSDLQKIISGIKDNTKKAEQTVIKKMMSKGYTYREVLTALNEKE